MENYKLQENVATAALLDQCGAEIVSPVSSASRSRGEPKAQSGGYYNL